MKKLLLINSILLFSFFSFAQENLYVAVDNGNQVYYINKAGKVVFKMDTTGAEISDFKNYKNGYLIVDYSKAGKLAIFDSKGKKIFTSDTLTLANTQHFEPFNNHFAIVYPRIGRGMRSKTGVIDTKGNFTIPLSEENIVLDYAGNQMFRRLSKDGKYIELLDEKGKFIRRYDLNNFERVSSNFLISDNLIRFMRSVTEKVDGGTLTRTKWGYMDIEGKDVIEPVYREAKPFYEGFALIADKGYGELKLINKNGNALGGQLNDYYLSKLTGSLPEFVNGMVNVCGDAKKKITGVGTRCGYVDTSGNWLIKPKYIEATSFSHGLAEVTDSTLKTRIINTKGETIIEGFFDYENGKTCWWDKDVIYVKFYNAYYDHKGKLLWKPTKPYYTITTASQLENLKEQDYPYVYELRDPEYHYSFNKYPSDYTFLKNVEKCVNLKRIYISNQSFGVKPTHFTDIYKAGKLEELILRSSGIEKIPAGISKLKNLKTLDLSHTSLLALPEDFGLLKLDFLNISGTQLIPDTETIAKLRKQFKKVWAYGGYGTDIEMAAPPPVKK
jgi:hypothetical protein